MSMTCAMQSRCLELIPRFPFDCLRSVERLPAQRKSELRHGCIARKIHRRRVLIARLMIAVGGVILRLFPAPSERVIGELGPGVDGKCGDPSPRQAEVIRAVVVTGAGLGISLNREAKQGGGFF